MRRIALVLLTMMFASVAVAGEKKPPVASVITMLPLYAAPGGKWNEDALHGAISRQRDALAPCWQPAIDRDPKAEWSTLAFFQIDAKGQVKSVAFSPSGDAAVDACVESGLNAFVLPAPQAPGAVAVAFYFKKALDENAEPSGVPIAAGPKQGRRLAGIDIAVSARPSSYAAVAGFRSLIGEDEAALDRCYDKHVGSSASPRLELLVQVDLDQAGQPGAVSASGSGIAELDACIAKVVSKAVARRANKVRVDHVDVLVELRPREVVAAGTPARVRRGDVLIGRDYKLFTEQGGQLRVAIHGKRAELDACYAAGLKKNKALAGTAVAYLEVDENGKVTTVSVVGLGGPKTEKCVAKALGTLTIAPPGDPFAAAFQLAFEPARP